MEKELILIRKSHYTTNEVHDGWKYSSNLLTNSSILKNKHGIYLDIHSDAKRWMLVVSNAKQSKGMMFWAKH